MERLLSVPIQEVITLGRDIVTHIKNKREQTRIEEENMRYIQKVKHIFTIPSYDVITYIDKDGQAIEAYESIDLLKDSARMKVHMNSIADNILENLDEKRKKDIKKQALMKAYDFWEEDEKITGSKRHEKILAWQGKQVVKSLLEELEEPRQATNVNEKFNPTL